MPETPMMAAALGYARAGIPVVPLHTPAGSGGCSCRRRCDAVGKHPRLPHGLHEASTDPLVVRRWWTRWPRANIGLVTGIVMDACDIDTPEGLSALRALIAPDGAGTPTEPGGGAPIAATGSGGWHVWYAPTGLGNRVGLLPGVDWRGRGGYVVAPPSRHACGRRYRWLRSPAETVPPECPAPLLRLVEGPVPPEPAGDRRVREPDRYARAALAGEVARVLAAPAPRLVGRRRIPGARNHALNRAAFALGQLVGDRLLDRYAVERELAAAARRVGLGRVEAARTIRSGLTAGMRRPRRISGRADREHLSAVIFGR